MEQNTLNEDMKWSGYNWLTQERWGKIHPDKSHWWYDSSQVVLDENGYMHLKTNKNPKYFEDLNITSNIGVGLLSCTEEFGYGTFEIEAKLPKGKNLWPAFWMYSWESWPPEIDVLEGYSDDNDDYSYKRSLLSIIRNTPKKYNIHSNVHYREDNKNTSIHELYPSHGVFMKTNPTQTFNRYTCVWGPRYIKILYNNILVREIVDPNILERLKGHKMNVIINNGVTSFANKDNPTQSDFVIKYFRYYEQF